MLYLIIAKSHGLRINSTLCSMQKIKKKKLKLKEHTNSDPETTPGRYWLTLISETLNMEISVSAK